MILRVTEVTVKLGHFQDALAATHKAVAHLQEHYPGYIAFAEDYIDTAEFNKAVHVVGYESLAKYEELTLKAQDDEEYNKVFAAVLEHCDVYSMKTRTLVQP